MVFSDLSQRHGVEERRETTRGKQPQFSNKQTERREKPEAPQPNAVCHGERWRLPGNASRPVGGWGGGAGRRGGGGRVQRSLLSRVRHLLPALPHPPTSPGRPSRGAPTLVPGNSGGSPGPTAPRPQRGPAPADRGAPGPAGGSSVNTQSPGAVLAVGLRSRPPGVRPRAQPSALGSRGRAPEPLAWGAEGTTEAARAQTPPRQAARYSP